MFQVTLILIISVATGLLAAIIYWIQRRNLYRGYEPIIEAARQIATTMKADTFRDGDDLVIAGSYQTFPAIVRFSYHQNTPGMHIEMHAPTTFDLWLLPKKVTTTKGRIVIRTGNSTLDSRFNARTDHPTQSRMLFGDKAALAHLEKLCCSTNTDFVVGDNKMDLTELSIPAYPAKHVTDHLESLNILANLLSRMPGAHEIKLPTSVRQERRTWIYPALGTVLLLAIIVALFSFPAKKAADTQRAAPPYVPAGMEPLDGEHVPRLDGWRLASSDDFSPAAAQFLEQHSLPANGKLKADFDGNGNPNDSAYLLIDGQGKRRIVMLAGGIASYDSIYAVDLIAPVPKANLANIQWSTDKPLESDGDGLLLVKDVTDPRSGLVLVLHNKQIDSAHPLDFTTINLYSGQ
jgi:hypothetical protein